MQLTPIKSDIRCFFDQESYIEAVQLRDQKGEIHKQFPELFCYVSLSHVIERTIRALDFVLNTGVDLTQADSDINDIVQEILTAYRKKNFYS